MNIRIFNVECAESDSLKTRCTEIMDYYDWKIAEFLNAVKGHK